ncbi:glycosyltransferase family 2 protein [Sphingomonas radiodurans]|uniref:glycosyltransferase family 2 protein n=1 Tax=Sphingomonas radiodurans TaxID=2890321 RepID=UPI001E451B87|nr:glycosyltransferase family 2 protein [Sphingomonas radiodurans]WBH17908.1 glycosyltransferase family 2 protein [Sphingomonas radiodurans]
MSAPGPTADLTVVILTYNKAHHIVRAIESVRGIARTIVVVDSFSTDATVALAQAAGTRVVQHAFVNHAAQFQWALDHGGIATGWTMRLDADEVIEPDLAAAIVAALPTLPGEVTGITFDRKHIFMGRWIRHGGRYPLRLLRLWRTGTGRVEQRWMDEHVVVERGRTIALAGGFADWNLGDLGFFTAKHNGYATREAIEVLAARYDLFGTAAAELPSSGQARRKRWLKTRVYDRLPLWVGPLGYFLYRYVVQLGFLDGRPGLIYHVLQGFWYRFLVAAKVAEWDGELACCGTREARIARLAELTGLPIA